MKCKTPCDCRFSNCSSGCSSCPVRCCRRAAAPSAEPEAFAVDAPSAARQLPFELVNGSQLTRISSQHPRSGGQGDVRLISIRTATKPSGHLLATGAAVPGFAGLTGLDFFAPDPLLEGLWSRGSFERNLPAELGVDFAIAPDFSVYWDDPRREQEYAIARSLYVCEQWTAAGVPMIPVASWARDEHRLKIAEFVRSGGYKTVALNFQMLHPTRRAKVFAEARDFLEASGVEGALICGGSRPASRSAIALALAGWSMTFASASWLFAADEEAAA